MIDLFELQNKIVASSHDYTRHYGIERSDDWVALKFAEEAGELVQAYIKLSGRSRHNISQNDARQKLADEVADVIGMALIIAGQYELDLHKSLESKWHIELPRASGKST